MAITPTDPSRERYRKAWTTLDRYDRRRILRAANRMQALTEPAEAAFAIEIAQQQKRLWVRWWWLLPVVASLVSIPRGWQPVVIYIIVGGFPMFLLSRANVWRANKAIRLNAAVVEEAQKQKKTKRSGSPKTRAKSGGKGKGSHHGGRRRR